MQRQATHFLTYSEIRKTKPWVTSAFVLIFVFVYFGLVWAFLGEFNLSGLDWVILSGTQKNVDSQVYVYDGPFLVFWGMWLFLFVPIAFYGLLLLVLRLAFKFLVWDMMPLTASTYLAWMVLILGAGISAWGERGSALIICARILIVAAAFGVSFFAVNKMTNALLMRSGHAIIYAEGLSQTEIQQRAVGAEVEKHVAARISQIIDIPAENILTPRRSFRRVQKG